MGNAIGIDLSRHRVRVVRVSRSRGRLRLLRMSAIDLGRDESGAGEAGSGEQLAEALRGVRLKANATIVIGLPYEKVFFSTLRTDVARPEDVRRLLRFELEDDLPLPFDELVADICSRRSVDEGQHEYLIAAVSRDEIDTWTRALSQAGYRCSVCSTPVCALEAVARLALPDRHHGLGMWVYVDGHQMILALADGGSVLCARHVACEGGAETISGMLVREIEMTVRATAGRPPRLPLEVWLSGPGELVQEAAARLAQVTTYAVRLLSPSPVLHPSKVTTLDGRFTIALGLALLGLNAARERLNFLSADLSQVDRTDRSRAKQAALVFGVLLVAILGLLGFRAARELRSLEGERAIVTREIRAVFTDLFPEEKKIVNETAQMKERLDLLRKERDVLAAIAGKRVQPLRILHLLSERMTAEKGIGISSFAIKDRTVHVVGTGGSFETIEQFLEELRQVPEFESIQLDDVTQTRGSDRPAFRLLISVPRG